MGFGVFDSTDLHLRLAASERPNRTRLTQRCDELASALDDGGRSAAHARPARRSGLAVCARDGSTYTDTCISMLVVLPPSYGHRSTLEGVCHRGGSWWRRGLIRGDSRGEMG